MEPEVIVGIVLGSIFGVVLLLLLILLLLRCYVRGPNSGSNLKTRMDGRVVVITGRHFYLLVLFSTPLSKPCPGGPPVYRSSAPLSASKGPESIKILPSLNVTRGEPVGVQLDPMGQSFNTYGV